MEKNLDNSEIIQALDRDAIVIANAGAGKTTLLVERYFEILSRGFEPGGVLAFTFTEKAAGEMKERILERFSTHPHFADLPPELIQEWRGRIWNAPIGTIHQFCLKTILEAEGPRGTGRMRIIEEVSEVPLRERVIREVLVEFLKSEDPGALALLKAFGISRLKGVLREYLEASLHPYGEKIPLPDPRPDEAELLKGLESLAVPIRRRWREEKERRGWINFDDMERRALDLLKNPPPLLKKRLLLFSHALVDEFQDTSPIQIEILQTLRAALKGFRRELRLFCVGDPKQSIYRFRKVDRNLIHKAEKTFLQEGGRRFQSVKNYRATPEVLDFVNLFAGKAFPEASPSEVVLDPDPSSRVALVEIPLDEGAKGAEAYRAVEARWVAEQVAGAIKEGREVGEMAVLARYSASFLFLIRELKNRGIPFSLKGGQELFDRQEVLDLLGLLKFLSNPREELSLVGVLRSPLCLVSDATLLYLRDGAGKENLWDYLKSGGWDDFLKGKPGEESEKLRKILKTLSRLLVLAPDLAPSRLLGDFLRQQDAGPLYASAQGDPDALLAMEQFIHWIRQIEEENQSPRLETVVDIFRGFQGLGIHKAPLGNLIESRHCLRLLTFHAAKGLEFDTVFIVGLERGGPTSTEKLIHVGTEFGLKIPKAENSGSSPRFAAIADFHREEEGEENKRLLYVGMTRAKRRLFLTLHPKPRGHSLQGLLQGLLGEAAAPYRISLPDEQVEKILRISSPKPGSPPLRLEPPSPSEGSHGERQEVTVSDLEVFQVCPVKYSYAARAEIPDTTWQVPSELNPAEKGTLLHAALRRLSVHPSEGLRAALEAVGRDGQPLTGEVLAELEKILGAYLSGPAARRLKEATQDFSELPFLLEFPAGRIRGQIDRLIREGSQAWRLIDFKFLTRSASEGEIRNAYEFQLKTYLLAARKILGEAVDRAEIHLLGAPRILEFHFGKRALEEHAEFLEGLLRRMINPNLGAVRAHPGCFSCAFNEKIPICGIPRGVGWDDSEALWN